MIFRSKNNRILILLSCAVSLLMSCGQIDVFEKNTSIPHFKWKHNDTLQGTFNISDTLSAYNLFIVLRHADSYKYNNIWLNVGLQSPADTMYYQKVDLLLGDDATGWYGAGMNDIWEVRKLLNGQPRRFIKKGRYQFTILQIMRDNPLPGIMSAGLRVEKVN